MKIEFRISLTLAFIAMLVSSCHWFDSKPFMSSHPLIGTWRLDSLHAKTDTGKASIGWFFLALAAKDSQLAIEFTPDSIYTKGNGIRTGQVAYLLNQTGNRFSFGDSVLHEYHYHKLNDSVMTIADKDSIAMHLRKQ